MLHCNGNKLGGNGLSFSSGNIMVTMLLASA
jgi:hypothetical protein